MEHKPDIEIFDELYDPRIHSEEYRKFILEAWEKVKPKRAFRFLTGKEGMLQHEETFYRKIYTYGNEEANEEVIQNLITKLREESPEGMWEFDGIGWHYRGQL